MLFNEFSDTKLLGESSPNAVTVLKTDYNDVKRWMSVQEIEAQKESDDGDYVTLYFDDVRAASYVQDYAAEQEDLADNFQNGDKVRLKPDYADRGSNEIFTISQAGNRPDKYWIGDEDGRGWYVRSDQIEKVETDDLDEHAWAIDRSGNSQHFKDYADKDKLKRVLDRMKQTGASREDMIRQIRSHKFFKTINPVHDMGEGDVIHTKFATKQAQKAKDKYQVQPDVVDSIPLYDPQRKMGVLPHLAKGHEEPFERFYAKAVSDKVSKIIGVTKDGKHIVTSTMGASVELASKMADAYNRGGFSDVPINKVPLKGYNEMKEEEFTTEAKYFRTAYGWAGGRNEKTGGMHKHPESRKGRLAMPLKGHAYHTLPDNKLYYIIKDAGEAALAMKGHSPDAEAKYLDQINDASTVLGYRKKGGKQVTADKDKKPEIMRAEGTERDQIDTVTVDVPLLIRLLEYAKEDAKTDMDLHNLAENLIAKAKEGTSLTMKDYNSLVPATGLEFKTEKPMAEAVGTKVKFSDLVRALRKHPSLHLASTEDASGSRKAWLDLVGKIKASDIINLLKQVDDSAKMQKVDVGFGPEIKFSGGHWVASILTADESGEDHNTLFVEVFKSGALGNLARAGIDEPETY